MDGVVVNEIDEDRVHLELLKIFGAKRMSGFHMDDTTAYFMVATARYHPCNGGEVERISAALGVPQTQIEWIDHPPNALRFTVECGDITRPETPSSKADATKERP